LIQEVAGGEITSDLSDIYPKENRRFLCFLNFKMLPKLLVKKYQKILLKILVSLDIKNSSFQNMD
jgi:phenylalanyl-tRNA synthetase beta chain